MADSRKRVFAVILSLILILVCMPLMPGRAAHGMTDFELDRTSVTFGKGSDDNELINITQTSCNIDPETARVDDESIATVQAYSDCMYVYPKGIGKTTLHVTGLSGEEKTIPIEVTGSFFEWRLKQDTYINNCWYGTKKLYVTSHTGAKGIVKIGKDKYKFTIGSKGYKKVKLKRVYKLNTKVYLTIKAYGYTYKETLKLKSHTDVSYAKASKKKIVIETYNVHKGDIVKFTYKGKTYSKKITKNKDTKSYNVTIRPKKPLTKNASVTFTIVNKDKKTLFKLKTKLVNWIYIEEDEGGGD